MTSDRNEPPFDSRRRYCPGGPAVFVNTKLHIAQCPGGCDIWFDTMMDEPTFPPHTITTTVTFEPAGDGQTDGFGGPTDDGLGYG